MASQITSFHLNHVSAHLNQTYLVGELLERSIISYDDIYNIYDPETDESQEVFQWLVFPKFMQSDYERLIAAKVPVIDSELGTWVGITSYGSPYSLYVYPELINVLFDTDITYRDLEQLSRC
jgi:hypothetical protein